MSAYRPSTRQSAKKWSDEEKRRRLHQVYLYILGLTPEQSDGPVGTTEQPSSEQSTEILGSVDEGNATGTSDGSVDELGDREQGSFPLDLAERSGQWDSEAI